MTDIKTAFRRVRSAFNCRAVDALRRAREALENGDYKTTFGRVAHFGWTKSVKPFGDGEGFKIAGTILHWCENPESLGMRDCGDAHDIVRLDHTGWYVDTLECETAKGAVYRWGRFYIPVIRDPYNDGPVMLEWSERVACADGVDDCDADNSALREAARCADSLAEAYAEASREHDTAWQAGSQWADLHAENSELRKKALALIADIKKQTFSGPICDALREKLNDWRDTIRDNQNTMARLKDGDEGDLIFWPGDKTLASAFNDGAGRSVIREAN